MSSETSSDDPAGIDPVQGTTCGEPEPKPQRVLLSLADVEQIHAAELRLHSLIGSALQVRGFDGPQDVREQRDQQGRLIALIVTPKEHAHG